MSVSKAKTNRVKSSASLQSLDSSHDCLSETTFDPLDNTNSANSGYSSTSSSSSTTQSNSSILQPIHVRDARTRSYLVGSVGCHDSLLGSDELLRYFPNGKIRVLIVSWNMSSRTPPTDINDLLLPESISYVPDLYAIGIQEGPSSDINEWQIQLQTTIGPSHVLFHSCTLGVLHLAIFLRRDLVWFCTIPEEGVFNSRPVATNLHKTKGAIGISFAFFGTSFLFINSHLAAHENKLKDRIEEYEKICHSLNLPKNLKPLNPRYVSKDVTARFDCVFWFGDLNFRLELSGKEVMNIINNHESSPSIESLIERDQLTNIMKKGLAFSGFYESCSPQFPPTYKFKFGTNDYDTVSQRVPSYTDRILYRSKRPSHISSVQYDWIPEMNTSDHKPIFSLLDVQIRPGRDYATRLNAGSFNRNVYIEALKKRATDVDSDNRRGSLVCSLM